jgi:hypothetical protein
MNVGMTVQSLTMSVKPWPTPGSWESTRLDSGDAAWLPGHPSPFILTALSGMVTERMRQGGHDLDGRICQHLHDACLHKTFNAYARFTTTLEHVVVQALLDVQFVWITLTSPNANRDLISGYQRTRTHLKTLMDAINYTLYEKHLDKNVRRSVARHRHYFGAQSGDGGDRGSLLHEQHHVVTMVPTGNRINLVPTSFTFDVRRTIVAAKNETEQVEGVEMKVVASVDETGGAASTAIKSGLKLQQFLTSYF